MKTNCLALIILSLVLWGCKNNRESGYSVRPEDFPAFLEIPENARSLRYATPENVFMMEGSYTLNYVVDDSFPPVRTLKFIHKQLSESDFFLLKYCPLNLFEIDYVWRPNTHHQTGDVELEWGETWASKTGFDKVTVYLSYHHKTERTDLIELYVYLGYFSERSPSSAYIKRYKERYPEDKWEKNINEIIFDKIWGDNDDG